MNSKGFVILFLSLLFIQYCESQSPPPSNQETNVLWSTINGAASIVFDTQGNTYVSSPKENLIYQLNNVNGSSIIFAGTGAAGFVNGDSFSTAQFNGPQGLAYDIRSDSLYVCDTANNAIRKINQGVVSTVASNLNSPVSMTIVSAYVSHWYSGPQSPPGFYVLSTDGTVTLVQDGPINDNCYNATYMGTPSASAPLVMYGNLDKSSIDTGFYPCENTEGVLQVQYPTYSIWYSFTGTGNLVNVSTCNSQTDVYDSIFVYRAANPNTDNSCDNLQCMGFANVQSHQNCYGTIFSFCSQANITYYIAVSSTYYFSGSSDGTLELAVFDIGPVGCQQCTCDGAACGINQCRGFCPDAPSCFANTVCVEGGCVKTAPNSKCTGAISIVGNSTIVGNNVMDVAPLTPVNAAGNCLQLRNRGLWYSSEGTGFLTFLSTCSDATQIQVFIHLYQSTGTSTCEDDLLCLDLSSYVSSESCGTFYNTELIYCSEVGVTYYYYVESESNLGQFGLVQQTSEETCQYGNDYNPPYGYTSFYESFSFTSFSTITSFTSWYED